MEKVKLIPLTKGKFALVDAEDYDELIKYKWCVSLGYAVRTIWHPTEKRRETISMHRQLLNGQYTKDKKYTDHINLNSLDNRKCNLRICTNSENMANSKRRQSAIKGVHWDDQRQKWVAQICYRYKRCFLGRFTFLSDAIIAYDTKAKELFGEFALLNFPGGGNP